MSLWVSAALRRVHFGATAVGLMALVLLSGPVEEAAAQGGPVPVDVALVVQQEVTPEGTFVATVMPRRRSVVGSAVDGRVSEFPVNDGQRVVAGQVLCQILTKTIEIELAGAQAELELRRQELAELENGSRPAEIAQAQARVLAAQALSDYARAKLRRTQTLFQQGRSVSEEEYDQAVSAATGADQSLAQAKEAYSLVVEGPRKEQIAQARARLAVQQEAVNQIEDRLAKYTVRAPFDGFLVSEHTEVGQWIKSGEPVAEVIELDPVEVQVWVPEASIAQLEVGMPGKVMVDSLAGEEFHGQISRIVPQADVRSRTFPVKVLVPNPLRGQTHVLKAGMLAKVTLPVGAPQQVLLVPKDALVLGGGSATVFVVEPGPMGQEKVRLAPVVPGVAVGQMIEVRGQLKAGDRVVIQGNERLRPELPVKATLKTLGK